LEAEGARRGLVDASAHPRPGVGGGPAARGLARLILVREKLGDEAVVPGAPGLALVLEEGEGGVVPAISRGAFTPLRGGWEDVRGGLLHEALVARAAQELLDEHGLRGHRGAGGAAGGVGVGALYAGRGDLVEPGAGGVERRLRNGEAGATGALDGEDEPADDGSVAGVR